MVTSCRSLSPPTALALRGRYPPIEVPAKRPGVRALGQRLVAASSILHRARMLSLQNKTAVCSPLRFWSEEICRPPARVYNPTTTKVELSTIKAGQSHPWVALFLVAMNDKADVSADVDRSRDVGLSALSRCVVRPLPCAKPIPPLAIACGSGGVSRLSLRALVAVTPCHIVPWQDNPKAVRVHASPVRSQWSRESTYPLALRDP